MKQLDQTLLDRACRYGNFIDVAQRTARIYHHMVQNTPQFMTKNDMSIYYEALHMIAMKVARLVSGRINDAEGWLDIAGYAMLVHSHLSGEEENIKDRTDVPNEETIQFMEKELMDKMTVYGGSL